MPIDNGPVKEFSADRWLIDNIKGMCNKVCFTRREMDISEFRAHMRNARREQLLAFRSLIDSSIEFIEGQEKSEEDKEATAGGVL